MMPEKIKIFYLITGLTIGGAEKHLLHTVRTLDKSRFEAVVGVLYDSQTISCEAGDDLVPQFEASGVRVEKLSMKHKLDLGAFQRLYRLIGEEKPDVIHTHLMWSDWLGRLIGRAHRVPVIVGTLHAVEPWREWRVFQDVDRWTSKFCDALIAVSRQVKNGIVATEKIEASRICVIPNAVEDMSPVSDSPARKRDELPLMNGECVIGAVGRLDERCKGHGTLLESLALLKSRGRSFHCVLIGNGPSRETLEKRAEELSLTENLTFAGMQQDVNAWLRDFDIFVQPSHKEGSPLSVIEAMAAGRPIVASDVGAIPEKIHHRQTGLLVKPKDPEALAHALDLLISDRALAESVGAAARTKFLERYELKSAVRLLETLYEEKLAQKKNQPVRVLEVVTSLDTGGVTTYLENVIGHLPPEKFNIMLASGMEGLEKESLKRLNIPHFPVALVKRINVMSDLKAVGQLVKLMRHHRIDLVHTHMAKADWIGGLAARLAGVPNIVSTAHGATLLSAGPSRAQKIFDVIEKITYRLLHHRVISVSRATMFHLLKKKSVAAQDVLTLWNGLAQKETFPAGHRRRFREQMGISETQPVILMTGRLTYPKAPDILIESTGKLISQWPDLICWIAGDGSERSKLEALIRQKKLERNVQLLGHRSDMASLLQAADLFVLSTYSEGLSLSVLEAMSAPLPVVASHVGGMPELVADGQTGLLVPAGNVDAMTEAIADLLSHPEKRNRLREAALQRSRNFFDAKIQAAKTGQVLLDLAASKKGSLVSRLLERSVFLSRIRNYYREEGWRRTVQRFLKFFTTPLYRSERLWFLKYHIVEPIVPIKARIPFKFREATIEDLQQLMELDFDSPYAIAEMLASKEDRCFVAENEKNGEIMAVQWCKLGPAKFEISPFGYAVRFGEGEIYFYNCRAKHRYRSNGIIPSLEIEIYRWLLEHGYHTIYTDIAADNEPSLKTFEKLGMQRIEEVKMQKMLGGCRIKVSRYRSHDASPVRLAILHGVPAAAEEVQYTGYLQEHNFKVDRIHSQNAATESFFARVCHDFYFFRTRKTEMIHTHDPQGLAASLLAARLTGTARLSLFVGADSKNREGWDRFFDSKVCRFLFGLFRGHRICFFAGEDLFQEWVTQGRVTPEEGRTFPPDISPAYFNGKVSEESAREELKISAGVPVIGTFIPLNAETDPRGFIHLCREIHQRLPECEFLLAGDGPMSYIMNQYVKSLGLAKKIRFLKSGLETRKVLKAMTVYVDMVPKQQASLMRFEAMACARPIFSFVPERSLRGGEETVLSVCEAADRLLTLLGCPDLAAVGNAERTAALNHFDSQHAAYRFAQGWQDVLAEDLVKNSKTHWSKDDAGPTFSGK